MPIKLVCTYRSIFLNFSIEIYLLPDWRTVCNRVTKYSSAGYSRTKDVFKNFCRSLGDSSTNCVCDSDVIPLDSKHSSANGVIPLYKNPEVEPKKIEEPRSRNNNTKAISDLKKCLLKKAEKKMSQIVHKVSRVESRLNSLFQGGTCCSCCKCEPPKESTDSNDHVNNKLEGKSKLIEVVDCNKEIDNTSTEVQEGSLLSVHSSELELEVHDENLDNKEYTVQDLFTKAKVRTHRIQDSVCSRRNIKLDKSYASSKLMKRHKKYKDSITEEPYEVVYRTNNSTDLFPKSIDLSKYACFFV
ncbi:uncharacterized protein LOC109597419 isoform X2 [Aethina tumida]|uniref:uncharacterized protein LOC109597419 isoform X2 n=1 Tax=Aethina tumida TaxID=116153 RepID=UPI00096AF603|nr:uncharacterized protein LOC109597419 isoform X2 [Aethina tumida]